MTLDFTFPLLVLIGLAAGRVDSIAGSGLIALSVLPGIGLPSQAALGTNKLQAGFGSGSDAVYRRESLLMGADQHIGACTGSHKVITKGTSLILPVFIIMVLTIIARLIRQNYR